MNGVMYKDKEVPVVIWSFIHQFNSYLQGPKQYEKMAVYRPIIYLTLN